MPHPIGGLSAIGQSVRQTGQSINRMTDNISSLLKAEKLMKNLGGLKEQVKASVAASLGSSDPAEVQKINAVIDGYTDPKALMLDLGQYEAARRAFQENGKQGVMPTFGLGFDDWKAASDAVVEGKKKARKEQIQKDITSAVPTAIGTGGGQIPFSESVQAREPNFSEPSPEYPVGAPAKTQADLMGGIAKAVPDVTPEDLKQNVAFQAKAIGMPEGRYQEPEDVAAKETKKAQFEAELEEAKLKLERLRGEGAKFDDTKFDVLYKNAQTFVESAKIAGDLLAKAEKDAAAILDPDERMKALQEITKRRDAFAKAEEQKNTALKRYNDEMNKIAPVVTPPESKKAYTPEDEQVANQIMLAATQQKQGGFLGIGAKYPKMGPETTSVIVKKISEWAKEKYGPGAKIPPENELMELLEGSEGKKGMELAELIRRIKSSFNRKLKVASAQPQPAVK